MKTRIHTAAVSAFAAIAAIAAIAAPAIAAEAPPTLRFAAMPLIDLVPVYAAEKEGLFAKNGVRVEFIPVGAAPARDQLLAAGQADAAVNEIQAVINFNRVTVRMKALRWALRPSPGYPHFFILGAKAANLTSAASLKGVEIGVSQGTIIEYVTERLLAAAGLARGDMRSLNVPGMPDRMALLASGQLKAATMPEPLASLARKQGATVILDDSEFPQFGSSVISFRTEYIKANPAGVRAFLAAVEEATALVNATPERYSSILAERQLVPPDIAPSFRMPPFPTHGTPSKAEFEDALSWMRDKNMLAKASAAAPGPLWADSVDASFLPR
ncbi:MAG: ABC transporter substrate-binding protein [Rectinemataceae bacterium]